MPFRNLFKRSESMSDKAKTSTEMIKNKKRATTLPGPKLPSAQTIPLALEIGVPKKHLSLFSKFIQKAVAEFPCFLELPIQVREQIWRELFPTDREVHLRVQYRCGEYLKRDFGFPPPVTFYVNRESRAETEKYYHFFSQIQVFEESVHSLVSNPFCYCINPSLDKLSVSFQSLWDLNYSCFLRNLLKEFLGCRKKVRVLEVVDVFQAPFVLDTTREAEVKKFMADNLCRFHYLDELRFVLDRREDLESAFVASWKDKVNEAFEREKIKYPHCAIPKVVCVSWKVREATKLLKQEQKS